MDTPDGGKFGGKGFRSTWQEACVAVATAIKRNPENEPGSTYDGDYVAPMIRDIGLCMAMGDTPADLMTAQMGKIDSIMNGGIDGAVVETCMSVAFTVVFYLLLLLSQSQV